MDWELERLTEDQLNELEASIDRLMRCREYVPMWMRALERAIGSEFDRRVSKAKERERYLELYRDDFDEEYGLWSD